MICGISRWGKYEVILMPTMSARKIREGGRNKEGQERHIRTSGQRRNERRRGDEDRRNCKGHQGGRWRMWRGRKRRRKRVDEQAEEQRRERGEGEGRAERG